MLETPEQASPAVARVTRREIGRAVRPLAGEPLGQTTLGRPSPIQATTLEARQDPTGPEAPRSEPAVEDAYRTFWSDLGIFLVVIVLSVLIARSQGLA